jgi:polar amino acid transport system permease protein
MDFSSVWQYKLLLWQGFIVTAEISLMAIIAGTIIGLLAGLTQRSRFLLIKAPVKVYIEIFRGSPLLMQLFFFYFGLSYLNVPITAFQAVFVVFALNSGAFIAEIVRSGLEAVSKGQYEAAESLGLSYGTMMRKVILPQAMKVSLPPLVGFYIGMIKDTSIASIIGYVELMKQGQAIANMNSASIFQVYLAVAAIYFIICYPLSSFVNWMERRVPA